MDFVGENKLEVRVEAPPEKGRSNEKLCSLLAECFGYPKDAVKIKSGFSSNWKMVDIESLNSEKEFLAGGKK